jgi:hypothetical protein
MAGRVRVVIHRREVQRLLNAEGQYARIRADLERRGHAVAAQAGPGNIVQPFLGHDRYRVHVFAQTHEAKANEARNRSLTRALNAAR